MDMTYQLMEQVTASAGTTSQTGAKRAAGTQNESDGGFDTMVRQKRQEAAGTAGKAEADAPRETPAEETPGTDDERLALAAAMLLQPQPEIVYVTEQAPETAAEALPELAAADELSGPAPEIAAPVTEQTPEETPEIQTAARFERPAEAAAAQAAEKPAAETMRAEQPAQAVETDPAPELPKVELDSESAGAELPLNTGKGETEDNVGNKIENIEIETPVFGQVEAAPVKVGAPEAPRAPVALEAPDGMEQLGETLVLADALPDENGVSRAELTLTPESLGRLTVEITHGADGSLHVLLNASTEKAAALLEKNAGTLQNLLAANGKAEATVEVRGGGETRQQFLNPDGQNGRQGQEQQAQQQQQQQRKPRQDALRIADFMNQLRLGLVDLGAAV